MISHSMLLFLLSATCVPSSRAQTVISRDSGNKFESTSDSKDAAEKSQCWLVAHNEYRDQISQYLGGRAKLIDMTIRLDGHPADMLHHVLKDIYNPYHWIRSTSRQGRSLLMLDDNYRYKSLSTLSIGVARFDFNVSDQPVRCIRGRDKEETLAIIRQSFLRHFNSPLNEYKGTLNPEDQICNMQILRDGDYAEFRYRCCQMSSEWNLLCHDLTDDVWVKFLLALIIIIKVLIVLYSPLFLPDSLYRQKYVAGQYIYHVPGEPLTLKVAVTQDPDQFGLANRHKTVRLSRLKNMEYFKTMVANSPWNPDKIYEVHIQEVRLAVKARRLLDSVSVPVSVMTLLYNNLLRCRVRRLEPLKECCDGDILSRFNPGFKMMTWHSCMKCFARISFVILLAIPWIIRVILYFTYEADVIDDKTQVAQQMGLKVKLPSSVVLHLTPVHGLFLAVYIIFIIDCVIYGVISNGMKEKFKFISRQCLRDTRERSRISILAWMTKLTVMPFKVFGIVGIIFFLPYIAILIIVTFPLVAFYIFPTLNLSLRLLIHLVMFMCPQRVITKFKEWSQKLTPVKDFLNTHEVTANEKFVKKHQYTIKGIILQLIIISMCLVSFWSITLLLMEIISFFVEMCVYTFMGVVVNAGLMLQYLTVVLLVFVYSKKTFSQVHHLYQSYHKVIHKQLIAMAREEITHVATKEALDQENSAFIVHGDLALNTPEFPSPQIRIKNHHPHWLTFGMLVFLDKWDTPLTPEKFFYETIDINYFGCPGPIYRNVCSALSEFLKIFVFLLFIFVVVMALGDAYQISTTNQLLATVVGGFIPFIFRYIFTSNSSVDHIDPSSIQFRTEFHKAINSFTQSWPVFDIIPVSVQECDMHEVSNKPEEKTLHPKKLTPPLVSTSSASSRDDAEGDDGAPLAADASGDHAEGDEVLIQNEQKMSEDTILPEVDIIVDVSTSKSRSVLLNKDFEKGSVSMLDQRHKNRMYRLSDEVV